MQRRILCLVALLSFGVPSAWAATETITANIGFDEPLAIVSFGGYSVEFGTVRAGVADVFTLSYASGLTAQNSSGNILYGFAGMADLGVSGSATQSIQFSASNYVADNGVTPSDATCVYGNTAAAPCDGLLGDPPGGGFATDLKVGLTITVDGTQTAGETAAPTFDLAVIYQ